MEWSQEIQICRDTNANPLESFVPLFYNKFCKGSQVPNSTFRVRGQSRIEDPNCRQQGAALLTYVRSLAYFLF